MDLNIQIEHISLLVIIKHLHFKYFVDIVQRGSKFEEDKIVIKFECKEIGTKT